MDEAVELQAARDVARKNLERALDLEARLQQVARDVEAFENGTLREFPLAGGDVIYASLRKIGVRYREMESLVKVLGPVKEDASYAAQWFEYGKRMVASGANVQAHEFLEKAYLATLPWYWRLPGAQYVGAAMKKSMFARPGEKELRLEVAAVWVPTLYRIKQKKYADALAAHMLKLVAANPADARLLRKAHVALGDMYERLGKEKFAAYHMFEARRILIG